VPAIICNILGTFFNALQRLLFDPLDWLGGYGMNGIVMVLFPLWFVMSIASTCSIIPIPTLRKMMLAS